MYFHLMFLFASRYLLLPRNARGNFLQHSTDHMTVLSYHIHIPKPRSKALQATPLPSQLRQWTPITPCIPSLWALTFLKSTYFLVGISGSQFYFPYYGVFQNSDWSLSELITQEWPIEVLWVNLYRQWETKDISQTGTGKNHISIEFLGTSLFNRKKEFAGE